MTVQEMRDELAAALGNRGDITDARYVRWLNWALYDLCGFHRKRLFAPKRFHELEDRIEFDSVVSQASYDLESEVGVDPLTELWAIEHLEEVDSGTGLDQKDWRDLTGVSASETGDPSEFCWHGGDLLFNKYPTESKSYRLWIYRFPSLFIATGLEAQTPIIPSYWHELVVLGAIYRGHEKLLEPDRADEARGQYVLEAGNRRDRTEWESQSIIRGLKVKRD
jgi:hypothetical protein